MKSSPIYYQIVAKKKKKIVTKVCGCRKIVRLLLIVREKKCWLIIFYVVPSEYISSSAIGSCG